MPLQVSVAAARGTVLELREMAFEEGNLMLVGSSGGVLCRSLDGKVVVNFALVDGCRGLGNELGPQHSLTIPLGGLIDGDLDTLCRACIGRVLERGVKVDVVGDGSGAVDIVLVGSHGVGERPLFEVRTRIHVVETAIPDDLCRTSVFRMLPGGYECTCGNGAEEGVGDGCFDEHCRMEMNRHQL